MATAAPPTKPIIRDRAETDKRVRHPLQALRGYIRRYVTLEGLGVALIYMAIWFWVGVGLDYGVFVLTGFDWVMSMQELLGAGTAMVVRIVLLGLLTAGLLAMVGTKVLLRLMREFNDRALALVLERRFPKELGDRLITAVEMADPQLSQQYGFSQPMLDKTIADAANRVERVPVKGVFNYGRVRKLWAFAIAGIVGMYILAAGLWIGIGTAVDGPASNATFRWRLWDTYAIWVERNIFLSDTYWPRKEFFEVIRFQDSPRHRGEMYIAKDSENRPPIKVRAFRWVIADSDTQEGFGGWRPLKWADLPALFTGDEAELLTQVKLPADWGGWEIDFDYLDQQVADGVLPKNWDRKTVAVTYDKIRTTLNKHPQALLPWLPKQSDVDKFDPLRADNLVKQAVRVETTLLQLLAGEQKETNPLAKVFPSFVDEDWDYINAVRGIVKVDFEPVKDAEQLSAIPKDKKVRAGGKWYHIKSVDQQAAQAVDKLFHWQSWSFDRIERQMQSRAVRIAMKEGNMKSYNALENVLSTVRDMSERFSMSRTLRELTLPPKLTIQFRGKKRSRNASQPASSDSVYKFKLGGLKESSTFTVTGDDYTTKPKKIRLQEPPSLEEFILYKKTPAYRYYRLVDDPKLNDSQSPLIGKRQLIQKEHLQRSDFEGSHATVFRVPIGSDLTIQLDADRELGAAVRIMPVTRRKVPGSKVPQQPIKKGKTSDKFSMEFPNVVDAYEFYFEFIDLDGIKGYHRVQIQLEDDTPPKFEEFGLNVKLRRPFFKTDPGATDKGQRATGFLITPRAYLPIKGKVFDDLGLDNVEWEWTFDQVDFNLIGGGKDQGWVPRLYLKGDDQLRRSAILASWLHMNPVSPGYNLLGPEFHGIASWYAKMDLMLKGKVLNGIGRATLPGFQQKLERHGRMLTVAQLEKRLKIATSESKLFERKMLKLYDLGKENSIFDAKGLPIKGFDLPIYLPQLRAGLGEVQKHYLLQLYVTGSDNNIEVGHQKTTTRKALTFLVVSEEELLAQILLEEFSQYNRLVAAHNKVRDHLVHVRNQMVELDSDTPSWSGVADRLKKARFGISKSGDMAKDVLDGYTRILKELIVNRVDQRKIDMVSDKIVYPLKLMTNGFGSDLVPERFKDGMVIGDFIICENELGKLYDDMDTLVSAWRAAANRGSPSELAKATAALKPKLPVYRTQIAKIKDKLIELDLSLDRVLKTLDKGMDYEKIVEILVDILESHNIQVAALDRWQREVYERIFKDLTNPKKDK